MDLHALFEEINQSHFDGFLDPPTLLWNPRLRVSAGQFFPGSEKGKRPARIEVASSLLKAKNASRTVMDALAHEMIHYWLWLRDQPYGHTAEFLDKMRKMGVSRYSPASMRRRPKEDARFVYVCDRCRQEFRSSQKLQALACEHCCVLHSNGQYDARFQLRLIQEAPPSSDATSE